MASSDNNPPLANGVHNTTEPKRKVSILADPPTQDKKAGHDNLGKNI